MSLNGFRKFLEYDGLAMATRIINKPSPLRSAPVAQIPGITPEIPTAITSIYIYIYISPTPPIYCSNITNDIGCDGNFSGGGSDGSF